MLQLHGKGSNKGLIPYIRHQIFSLQFDPLNNMLLFSACNLTYTPNLYDSVNVSKDPSCNGSIHWRITYYPGGTATDYYADNVTFPFNNTYEKVMVRYWGCDVSGKWFQIYPLSFENVPEPWAEDTRWLAQGQTLRLDAYHSPTLNYLWPDGSTDWHYTITGPEKSGKVWVRMYNDCGFVSDTINVYYNTEPATVTVDPNTNKNLVVWEITPEQAVYISNVIINRDGVDMATVPYTDGQYLDNIGSDLAARVYTLKAVCPDGTQCPFPSRQRGTIHMAFLPDINGNVEMTWNQPELGGADIHVGRFEICEYDPESNEISVIDFVSSVTTSYSCNLSMFDYGYPLIRAVIQDGRSERDILSNRTNEIVGQTHEITITLTPGWNWISYPYAVSKGIDEALGDFIPVEGDIIKSRLVSSSYTNGRWRGGVNHFTPGWGYMYYSSRNEPATLVFDLSSSR